MKTGRLMAGSGHFTSMHTSVQGPGQQGPKGPASQLQTLEKLTGLALVRGPPWICLSGLAGDEATWQLGGHGCHCIRLSEEVCRAGLPRAWGAGQEHGISSPASWGWSPPLLLINSSYLMQGAQIRMSFETPSLLPFSTRDRQPWLVLWNGQKRSCWSCEVGDKEENGTVWGTQAVCHQHKT